MKKVKQIIGTTLTASLATGVASTVAGTIASAATIDEIYKAAYEATMTALANKDQDSINAARVAISKLPSQFQGFVGEFSKQVDSVQHPILVKIVDAINNADKTGKQVDINAARNVIPAGLPDVWKNSYSSGVDKVQQKVIDKAVAAVNTAVASGKQADIDAAKAVLAELALVENNEGVKSWVSAYEKDFVANIKLGIDSISIVSNNTFKVNFLKEIDSASLSTKNFKLYDSESKNELFISSTTLSQDKKSVEVKLADTFADNKNYTVEVKDLKDIGGGVMTPISKDFGYAKADIASVTITKDKVKVNDKLTDLVIVKDSLERDITSNSTVEFETSNAAVVTAAGLAKAEGSAIVTPVIKDTKGNVVFRGQNTIITVKNAVATEYQGYSVYTGTIDATKNTYSQFTKSVDVKMGADAGTYKLATFFKDQYGTELAAGTTFADVVNLNPDIAILDKTTGQITTISEGTAYFKVTVEGVQKTISVNVTAASKAAALTLDKASTTLVKGGNVSGEFKVGIKDQYGAAYSSGTLKVQVKNAAGNYVAVDSPDKPTLYSTVTPPTALADGESIIKVAPAAAGSVGSNTYKVTYESTDGKTIIDKEFVVNVKDQGTLTGYEVETISQLDFTNNTETSFDDRAKTFNIYAVDSNGARVQKLVDADADVIITDKDGKDVTAKFVVTQPADTTTAFGISIVGKTQTDIPKGNYTVTVKVGTYTAKSYTLSVIDSKPAPEAVTFKALSASTSTDITDAANAASISDPTKLNLKGITTVIDQFGKEMTIAADGYVAATAKAVTTNTVAATSTDLVITEVKLKTTAADTEKTIQLAKPVVVRVTVTP